MLANYHTHTTFCDGKSTAEEIVNEAISRGLSVIGFSGHGYTDFDLSYCMTDTEGYIKEINRLKKKYADKIDILLGIEEDAYCPVKRGDFDYVIGSCHYSRVGDKWYPIDSSPAKFKECIDAWGGDVLSFAEQYYETLLSYTEKMKPDIVGHFDLITKYDEDGKFGMLNNPEYHALAESYMRRILDTGALIEVNTGAISRGYRTTPYPSINLLKIIKSEGGRLILNSDSHHNDTLTFRFEEIKNTLSDLGFGELYALTSRGIEKYGI